MTPADRIVALCERATPAQRAAGLTWYPTARAVCETIAQRHGTTTTAAAAVMAITSPDCQLSTNVRWTEDALRTKGRAKVGRYPNRMVPAVRSALRRKDPLTAVSGPKVDPFARAILGDTDAVVIDRWAIRIATGSDKVTVKTRREAQAAYREAAQRLGMTPRDCQAVAWRVARDDMTRRDGTRVRLVDIHDIHADLEEAA